MKRIYISVPMRGRTDEAIQASFDKMEKCAKILIDDEVVVVNQFDGKVKNGDPKIPMNHAVQMLGESISLMSLADMVIGVTDDWEWPGCYIEGYVCDRYRIPRFDLPRKYVCPDLKDREETGSAVLYADGEPYLTVDNDDT